MMLIVTWLVKNSQYFIESEGSLLCLQKPATGPNPYSAHTLTPSFFMIHYYPPIYI